MEVHGTSTKTTTFTYLGLTNDVTKETFTGDRLSDDKTYTYDANGLRISMIDDPSGTAAPKTYTYGYDVHGSVSTLLDDSTGTVKATYGYDAYGNKDTTLSNGDDTGRETDPLNPFRYSARRFDTGSGTLDMGARRFGPDSQTFLQPDHYQGALENLGLSMDPLTGNRYSLAGGNPVSYVEFDGHRLARSGSGGGGNGGSGGDGSSSGDGGGGGASSWIGGALGVAGSDPKGFVEGFAAEVSKSWRQNLQALQMIGMSTAQCSLTQFQSPIKCLVDQAMSTGVEILKDPGGFAEAVIKDTFGDIAADIRRGDFSSASGRGTVLALEVFLTGAVGKGARASISATRAASSAAQGAQLRTHLRLLDEYGVGGFRELGDGRFRYYGDLVPATKSGEMAGARLVREWSPASGNMRTWYETLDRAGRIRQVHPYQPYSPYHYVFDEFGQYSGRW